MQNRVDSIARFDLRLPGGGGNPAGMKTRAACLLTSVVLFSACDQRKEVVVTETRPVTTRDVAPKLSATSGERFRDAKPSPVKAVKPEGWLVLPASQFRILNYRFGESGMGEVWVSLSAGSVLDNVNRWLSQFGSAPLDEEALNKLPSVPIVGTTGKWVTAEGAYVGGMGATEKPGFALAGVVTQVKGQILTVKMVGPKAEVEIAKPELEAYARSLTMVE